MDFKFPDHYELGVLNGDDLIFFYYDIGLDNLQGWPAAYDWDKVLEEFKDRVDIAACAKSDIPAQIEDNKIRFTVSSQDSGSEASAFFRHLRNAFSHYRITRQGDWFFITDYNEKSKPMYKSMYGKISSSLLKAFCSRFFDAREKILNDAENANNLLNK